MEQENYKYIKKTLDLLLHRYNWGDCCFYNLSSEKEFCTAGFNEADERAMDRDYDETLNDTLVFIYDGKVISEFDVDVNNKVLNVKCYKEKRMKKVFKMLKHCNYLHQDGTTYNKKDYFGS